MAINLPMPALPLANLNQSIATGGNLFQQMMNPVIQRENMQREWQTHLDNLALQQQQENRLGAMLPYQKEMMRLQLEAAQRQADPQKALEYQQQWQNAVNQMMPMQQESGQSALSGGASGIPLPGDEAQGGQSVPTISVLGREMPLPMAQMLMQMGAPIPGLKEQMSNYYNTQKKLGEETAKARVKRQGEIGDQFSASQDGLMQIGRINQLIKNYEKESKDMGFSPHFGVGAELRTAQTPFERLRGRIYQDIAHPLEAVTNPDISHLAGGDPASKMHDKYLGQLRAEFISLVGQQAKNLNTRFTQKEYETLLANKPSISDSEDTLKAKLKAVEDAIRSGSFKLQMQNQALSKGATPGTEPFWLENQIPSESTGAQAAGIYETPRPETFTDGEYEYKVVDGKTYRRKR